MYRFILFFCLLGSSLFGQTKFEERYAEDYLKAVKKTDFISALIDSVSQKYHLPGKEIISIVFPEMVRYSLYSDAVEVEMLKIFYVEKGAKYADFSIGAFQIKPSFAESIENEIKADKKLKEKYASALLFNDTFSAKEARIIRLARLQNITYQLTYVCGFYDVMELKYKKIVFKDTTEKLRLYATAYNCGLYLSYEQLIKRQKVKLFPEGKICIKCDNYNYADISTEFYTKLTAVNK